MSRNTIQQEIICNIVKSMRTHPSPDEVYKEVHEAHPRISRATVYRVLNKLADKGEILKVKMPDTAYRFDFNTEDHLHIYCRECGKVFDADMDSSAELIKLLDKINISDDLHGFKIDNINLSLEGTCPNCRANKH